jgi:FAD:protein FMN transferase
MVHLRKFILIVMLAVMANVMSQNFEYADEAFRQAKREKLPLLLVFSGSDWCRPCIRFKKEVLDDPAFTAFCQNRVVVLKADFPQHKIQSDETIKQNEKLAESFNPEGVFPKILLLDNEKQVLATMQYTQQNAAEFINQLESLLPKKLLKEYKKRFPAMGSFFEIIIVDSIKNENEAWNNINRCIAEVDRIERLISEWKPGSEVSLINQNAGIKPVVVSEELYRLIERSIEFGKLTQGAFDITFHALDGLWKFDGSQTKPPDSVVIKEAIKKIGYQRIQLLDSNKVFLPEKGMSVGFGGIGQGYAVDRLRDLLLNEGINNFVVNSSGDIYAEGKRADCSAWKIGVADPFNKEEIIRWLNVEQQAVVTSGNYEKFFIFKGQRYAHILNPKTGWPTQGIMSATVISPYTEVADAMATAIFVLGVQVSLDLVNQLPGTHCIIVDDKKNVYYSQDLVNDNK